MLIQTVHKSPNYVHILSVESHAHVAGDECADAVFKYQATQVDTNHADRDAVCWHWW